MAMCTAMATTTRATIAVFTVVMAVMGRRVSRVQVQGKDVFVVDRDTSHRQVFVQPSIWIYWSHCY